MKPANNNPYFIWERSGTRASGLRPAGLDESIKYCLRALILCHVGEHPVSRALGSRVRDHLFRPWTQDTERELSQSVQQAIAEGEPRVELLSSSFSPDEMDRGKIQTVLEYRVKETQKVDHFRLAIQP